MINSRNLDDLHPIIRKKCQKFIELCKESGVNILITSTLRDHESQNDLYAQGRTKPGKIVTNAKGGESYHNFGQAFDFVPMVEGQCIWNDTSLFNKCGNLAKECGLEWGGDFRSFKDLPHCQFTGGLSLSDLRSGKILS